jgi:anthranilate phosphoribosyltransferase
MTTPITPSTESINILPLLKRISNAITTVTPDEITHALTRAFHGQLSPVQTGALLTSMHYTALDTQPSIIAAAAKAMRGAGMQIHGLQAPEAPHGSYGGGFVDIVGTGGDGHDTFNVSTTAAIVVAGCGLKVCTVPHLNLSSRN